MGHLKMDQPFELSTAACKLCFVHPLSPTPTSPSPPPPPSLRPYIKRDHGNDLLTFNSQAVPVEIISGDSKLVKL